MDRRTLLGALATTPALAACGRSEAPASKPDVHLATAEEAIRSVRPLGFPWETLDPFLFCVHHDDAYPAGNERLGPAASLAGRNIGSDFQGRDGWSMYHGDVVPGFPQHPHRGFETVTVVRRGLVDHADSLGAGARYGGGDTQWLTAGKGIVHAEMFPLLDGANPNPLELFQIWLNLPRASKFAEPHFSMFWRQQIPRVTASDAAGKTTEITLVAGRLGEHVPPSPPPDSWASRPDSDIAIWTLKMAPGARWTLPAAAAGSNRMLYFFLGSGLRVAGREIPSRRAISLRADLHVQLEAGPDGAELLMLQGKPIGEPVAQRGPFVMNTPAEIQQAFLDYQRTRFGGWPWKSDGPVHDREDRFARHADGRIERAT
jgi:redox-sensitive bicupin YhaK (pirin superfamily)